MKFKRFYDNDHVGLQNSYQEAQQKGVFDSIPTLAPSQSLNFSVPPPLPARKGRFLAVSLVALILGYSGYVFWNSYLRYESFGIVEAKKVSVYSVNSGFVSELRVKEGSRVVQGDTVALVASVDDQRSLERVDDELAVAKAELVSKRAEIAQTVGSRTDSVYQIKGTILVEEGLIAELESRVSASRAEVSRLAALMRQDAASAKEYDAAVAQVRAGEALIAGKKRYVASLKERVKTGERLAGISAEDSLAPIERKVSSLANERVRIADRIADGMVRSPVTGTVSEVTRNRGEKVTDSPLFTVVQDNTTNLVLFYDPSDKIPPIGSAVAVASLSNGERIDSTVVAVSKDVVSPPDQIKRNYYVDQKMVKVYLEPHGNKMSGLVVGSVIKKPNPQDILTQPLKYVSSLWSREATAETLK